MMMMMMMMMIQERNRERQREQRETERDRERQRETERVNYRQIQTFPESQRSGSSLRSEDKDDAHCIWYADWDWFAAVLSMASTHQERRGWAF
jgi:hypothetical protein